MTRRKRTIEGSGIESQSIRPPRRLEPGRRKRADTHISILIGLLAAVVVLLITLGPAIATGEHPVVAGND